jgi:signal transduction histidine kinase
MALFFTAMLSVSAVIIGYFLYDFSQQIPAHLYSRFQTLSFVIVVLMSIVVLVSFLLSHFVVSRINLISETAQQIMQTGDLTQRIQIKTKADDLSNLAQVLNEFLSRMESLMSGIRDVSDNIAHDLRTPLSHLRQQIEELKNNPRDDGDIDALLSEADRILDIFNSLLRIVNLEKGKRTIAFSKVNLFEIISDVIELYEPLGEEKELQFHVNLTETQILGDKNLLFQLFANLLSNAIKFSPKHSTVDISMINSVITIKDNGIGIAEHERERVFERFYRVESSRTQEGNGLGLTLVKAIVDLHQGEMMLKDNLPGLIVVVTLPKIKN